MTGGPIATGLRRKDSGKGVNAEGRSGSDTIGRAEESVPRLVKLCIDDIDARGLNLEGIYRVSGRHANVQELRHLVEKDEAAFEINPQADDIYCVSGLLKQYLRELPEPVFRFPLSERVQHTKDREEHITSDFLWVRSKIRRLSPIHQATLRLVIEHLARVASHQSQNKMDAKNLSIVFGTLLFGEDEMPTDVLSISTWKDTVLEDLINFSALLFEEKAQSSPPLPPAPPEEPTVIDYGSSHTQVYALSSPLRKAGRDVDLEPVSLGPSDRPEQALHASPAKTHHRSSSAACHSNDELPPLPPEANDDHVLPPPSPRAHSLPLSLPRSLEKSLGHDGSLSDATPQPRFEPEPQRIIRVRERGKGSDRGHGQTSEQEIEDWVSLASPVSVSTHTHSVASHGELAGGTDS